MSSCLCPAHLGIRNHRYKLMFLYGDRLNSKGSDNKPTTPAWEFHDLLVDPFEDRNLYDSPEYSAIIESMKKELLQIRSDVGDTDDVKPKMKEIIDSYYW